MPKPPGIKEKTSDSAPEETRKKTGEIEDPARKMSPIFLPRKSAMIGDAIIEEIQEYLWYSSRRDRFLSVSRTMSPH